jgi:beta-galactosidase GanA
MRRLTSGLTIVVVALVISGAASPALAFNVNSPVFGHPHRVTYDRYSVKIAGQRLVIWSGEFHMFRLPSPMLWRDVLEKIRAAGFNTVSLYFSWAYFSPAPGVYNFRGIRNVGRLLTMAQRAGLYVIARPGPYINAELDAGGFPGWLTRQLGAARTSAPDYTRAWKGYLSRIDPIIARHQITRGGSVIAYQIENELLNTGSNAPYMRAIVRQVRHDGINVPTTTNLVVGPTWEPIVNVDGPDIYPQGFNCGTPNTWSSGLSLQIDHIQQNARADAPNTPEFLPEFQAGSFDPWGGRGYSSCYQLTDGAFEKVLNLTGTAQGVTMRNLYMLYGGTSWGYQPVPTDYTSYDYGAPIDEARELTPKYYDLKRLAYASAALAPLAQTNQIATPTGSNPDLLYAARGNPRTHTQFIFLRHHDPTSTANSSTTLSLKTQDGTYPRVPEQPGTAIWIHGRDMKMLVADFSFGQEHLVYSTSELMTQSTIGGRDVAVLYGTPGDPGETVLRYRTRPHVSRVFGEHVNVHWDGARHDLRLDYRHGILTRLLIRARGRRPLLLLIDGEQDSGRIWLDHTASGPVLTYGPYLVRHAILRRGVLRLAGDTSASFPRTGELGGATGTSAWSAPIDRPSRPTPLVILAAPRLDRVSWDGRVVRTRRSRGELIGKLAGPPPIHLPALRGWRFSTEAPEAKPSFNDSHWTRADHLRTNNISHPPETLPVLYMDDYGFHYGNVWYRGHFKAAGSETGMALDCAAGGPPAECLVWFNGHFLAGTSASGMHTYRFPAGTLRRGRDNVVSVLAESEGHPEDLFTARETQKAPRGLAGARLVGSVATVAWRIQGALGGERPPSMLRGPMNTGGLFGERHGWYLPGHDDRHWRSVKLPDRWAADHIPPGVGWYRTSFRLHLPAGVDVPIGLRISDHTHSAYEALIFLNGWMMGRYANNVGPQHLFYLPEGILRPRGRNVLAIADISHGSHGGGGGLGRLSLQAYGRYRGGYATG